MSPHLSDTDLPGMWAHDDFEGGDPDSYAPREGNPRQRWQAIFTESQPCRFGFHEYDMARYCHEHGGFHAYMTIGDVCDRHPINDDRQWRDHMRRQHLAAIGGGRKR